MTKIQQIFHYSWDAYCSSFQPDDVQQKSAYSIMNCKTGKFGYNISPCSDCGYTDFHANACRNRNYPNCQAVLKEIWIDKRRSEVIDTPYFHVVFTIPADSIHWFMQTRSLCIRCFTDAPLRHF